MAIDGTEAHWNEESEPTILCIFDPLESFLWKLGWIGPK